MKKSFLTPVLAGVLAVSVVGSGAAYYFEIAKDSGTEKNAGKSGGKSTAMTVDQAADTIEAQLDKAQQIAKGELDGGYKAEVSYKAPSGSTEIGDISMTMEAKQKDKMSAVDYSLGYNSKTLLSANIVYDNDSETAYMIIPELSDAYLTGTADDINSLLEENTLNTLGTTIYDDTSYTADSTAFTSTSASIDSLDSIDFDVLFADLSTYGDVIEENVPDPTDGDDYTVEADGVSLTLSTKVYTVTSADASKVCTAVADKAKSDETLKSALTSLGISEDDYNNLWDELTDIDETGDETVTFDVYYLGGEVAGCMAKNEDGEEYHMITASDGTNVVVDWNLVTDGEGMTANGAVSQDGDTLNGKISMEVLEANYSYSYGDEEDSQTVDATKIEISYNSVTVTDDSVVGEIVYTINADDTNASVTANLNNVGDNLDTSFSVTANGEDCGSVSVKCTQTDASDITVPSGTMLNVTDEDDLESYLNGCDIDGWLEKVKAALGDELYNEIFGSSYDYDDYSYDDYSYDDDDYNYDYDDYDWSDYDWDDVDA